MTDSGSLPPNPSPPSPRPDPTASIKTRAEHGRRFSLVWLIPIVAAVVGAWLAYKTFSERGPEITIHFQTATGLAAGKTEIRHKNVKLGVVEKVELADDMETVVVTARMEQRPPTDGNEQHVGVRDFFDAREVVRIVLVGLDERALHAERIEMLLSKLRQRFPSQVLVFADEKRHLQRRISR